ncbi:YigZ family protein, partial [Desulfovibrio sp.]
MSRFPIPAADAAAPFQTEIIIRRSRFLTHCAHTPGMEAARAFVEQIRTKHADATHNCWAFVAGAPGHSGQVGFSDDGEPHGTAGRPMLQVLLHCGVGEITMVVTRWFGGVKLGTGGLVRAYQDSVRENLATLPLAEKVPTVELDVQLDYAHLDRLHRLLPTFEARVCAEA